jgi:bifunctional ADP-heptose synthase (sugar kinase/adenylyltransferase)
LGDVLIVELSQIKRVKQMKGDDRPIWDQNRRKQAVESVEKVTQAFILPEEFNTPIHHAELIKELRPNYLAVSSHSPHQAEKARIMGLVGGEVKVVYDHNPDVSTTLLVDQFTDH